MIKRPPSRQNFEPPEFPVRRAPASRSLVRWDDLPERNASRLRSAARRSAKASGYTIAAFAGILIAAAAILYVRLWQGPIAMNFLVPSIEEAVNSGFGGEARITLKGAVLQLGDNRLGVEFRMTGVSLLDEKGETVAQAPGASISLSLPALFTGRVAARQINFIGAKVLLNYTEGRGLALSFSPARTGMTPARLPAQPQQRAAPPPGNRAVNPPPLASSGAPPEEGEARIELVKALSGFFDETRRRGSATSYLTQFGLKNSSVYLDFGDRMSRWEVPEAQIKLTHKDTGSTVSGIFSIATAANPWRLEFRAQQDAVRGRVALTASAADFIPAAVGTDFPGVPLLKSFAIPMKIDARATMQRDGTIAEAELNADLGAGLIYAPWEVKHPASIDQGIIRLSYTEASSRVQLLPSSLSWGQNRIDLTGEAVKEKGRPGGSRWNFNLYSPRIVLGVEEFNLPSVRMDTFAINGNYEPEAGVINLNRFQVQAADASVNFAGRFGVGSNSDGNIQLRGTVSPMPVAFVKLIWPKLVAAGAREWAGENVLGGHIAGGSINVAMTRDMIAGLDSGGDIPNEAVSVQIDATSLVVNHIKGLPPLRTGKARVTITGRRFLLDVPEESRVVMPSGAQVTVSSGQFIIPDLRPDPQAGEVHFKANGTAAAVAEMLDLEPLGYVRKAGLNREGLNGNVTASFSFGMPLVRSLTFAQVTIRGKARAEDIKAQDLYEDLDVQGGAIQFDVNQHALDAQGEVKVNGVPIQVAWQRIFDAPAEHQPKLRLHCVMNEKAREQFGLPVNHFLRGNIAVNLAVGGNAGAGPAVSAEIDLTPADLILTNVGWRKPPGQRAVMSFDTERQGTNTLLKDVRIFGDDLSIVGSLTLNEQRRLVAFEFPTFSFNLQTKMEVAGTLTPQNNWKVDARGTSYDGRQLFRALFSAGQLSESQPLPPKDEPGLELHAEIGTVIGYFDTTLKNVTVDARKRGGKLAAVDVNGRLNGTSAMAVRLDVKPGKPRYLVAEALNAGDAFRLVGFYPAVYGGRASLKVDLDGDGVADLSGVLYAEDFVIVGDQVVEKVVVEGTRQGKQPPRQATQVVAQDQMPFDRLQVPFAVGHGQFVLRRGGIKGPLIGATISGNIDFGRDTIDLSGTYVPLHGVNAMLGGVPFLGDIFAPNGEGMFGIKFAVQGSMTRPNVMVNPMSLLTPGFLQGIWDDHEAPRIIPHSPPAAGGKQPAARQPQ